MPPKISVIIPTYYRNDLLPKAIESVLDQEYEPIELIVVDDSGEGHAEPVIRRYDEVRGIVHEENRDWNGAYATGIEASTGEYVQFLDDDDELLAGKLTKTAEVLRANPDVGVSYCGVIRNGERNHPKPAVSGDFLEEALAFHTFPMWTGSMLMERDVLLDCLPLAGMGEDDDLEIELGDTDLKIELALRTETDYVDECLAMYRQDTNGKWTGPRRFQKVKQNVEHRRELYDQYPSIRRELLASWHQRQARYWLEEKAWSAEAVSHFLRAAYYANGLGSTLKCGAGAATSLLGRPGWNVAWAVRNSVTHG
ncbi:glycosyltransferase family 2 protein [Halorubrum lipolyticum]|uniref:Glycosyl transferase n=1 Tax=Halorubrum lipolyticum DSM 21995 TaxID=1227482 RepID=M0P3S7_9EURY|nr:glycosyltransferase family 2 protein [Halorubrum lipolyticum]EMA64458.1 glycosyl transferase [Halorubrum lipolyticum DSM 21995]